MPIVYPEKMVAAPALTSTLPPHHRRHQPPRLIFPRLTRPALQTQLAPQNGETLLLVGPTGCGKTTMLVSLYEQLREAGYNVRWLSLGEEDNDPQRLRAHLSEAFAAPTLGKGADTDTFPAHTIGFLDGLEHLKEPKAQAYAHTYALSVPLSSGLYVTAHQLKGPVLQDGRLRGVLRVVGPGAWRMSDTEAQSLLGPAFTATEAQHLNRRVHGWAAGLRLLAQAPEASLNWLHSPLSEATLPPLLAQYFEQVICAPFDAAMLNALMTLSVLERFNPDMLAALPEPPCDWARVEHWSQAYNFLSLPSGPEQWVTVQPAFGAHMRQRLRKRAPDQHDTLQQFAARWFIQQGLPAEAMCHAVQLRDKALAEQIIEQAGAIGISSGVGVGPDVSLPTYLPPERAGALPWLFLGQVYHRVRHGRLREARHAFEQACAQTQHFQCISPDADAAAVQAWVHCLQVVFISHDDRPVPADLLQALESDLSHHLGIQPVLTASLASVLAYAYLDLARYHAASAVSHLGLQAQLGEQRHKANVFLHLHQASAALAQESPGAALLSVENAQRLAAIDCGRDSYEVLSTQLMRGVLHGESNELQAAQALIQPVLARIRSINGWLQLYVEGFSLAAALAGQTQGLDAAETLIRAGEAFAHERELPRLLRFMAIARLRARTQAGDHKGALLALESPLLQDILTLESDAPYDLVQQAPAQLAAAQLMLALGRSRDAQAWLSRLHKPFLERADCRLRFEFRVLAMQVAYSLRRYNAASEHLQAAVDLARRANLLWRALAARTALLEVADTLDKRRQGVSPSTRSWIDSTLGERAAPALSTSAASLPLLLKEGLPASLALSPRETEVLALVAEGYSNKEISLQLGITEGTVKSHRKHAYERLGVNSRSRAIQRARELLII